VGVLLTLQQPQHCSLHNSKCTVNLATASIAHFTTSGVLLTLQNRQGCLQRTSNSVSHITTARVLCTIDQRKKNTQINSHVIAGFATAIVLLIFSQREHCLLVTAQHVSARNSNSSLYIISSTALTLQQPIHCSLSTAVVDARLTPFLSKNSKNMPILLQYDH